MSKYSLEKVLLNLIIPVPDGIFCVMDWILKENSYFTYEETIVFEMSNLKIKPKSWGLFYDKSPVRHNICIDKAKTI